MPRMAVAHHQVTHQHAARSPRFRRRFAWNGVVHFLLLPGSQRLALEECDTKRPHQQQVASHYEWLRPQVYTPALLKTSIQLLNREGTAILFSSHHMTGVERLGGRVVLLDDGKVRLDCQLDQIHEEHCVAIVPRNAAADSAVIESLPGCLRVRPVFGDWHAVFEGTPDSVCRRLRATLGMDGILAGLPRCRLPNVRPHRSHRQSRCLPDRIRRRRKSALHPSAVE